MQAYLYTAIVTLPALLVYVWMGTRDAAAHRKSGIFPPAMTGDPVLERTVRAHTNTLEWLPVFLPSLWLFAVYWNDAVAASLGVVWIAGRLIYFFGYVGEPKKRFPGFLVQFAAVAVLLLGGLGRLIYLAWTGAHG